MVGIDNLNTYYDPALKQARLAELARFDAFRFRKLDLKDRDGVAALFAEFRFTQVIHLAAQPGVRHSLTAPHDYIDANIVGFLNVLEGCRHAKSRHLLYASSSSVYGANTAMPFRRVAKRRPSASLYGASKKANELMAHAYAHLFELPTTGLRYSSPFTDPGAGRTWRCRLFADAHPRGPADQAVQSRRHEAGLHLCRRCRHLPSSS